MYTGNDVRIRAVSLVVGLLLAVTPVSGVLCQMDCDQVRTLPACHEAMSAPDGPALSTVHHPCDHDHTASTLGAAIGTSARDSAGAAHLSIAMPALSHTPASELRTSVADTHAPPRTRGRSVSSLATFLRI